MAIIPDKNDIQGMFSKAGRFTSEKYIVFQKKDEILHNKIRYAKTSMMPEIPIQLDKNKQTEQIQENINQEKQKQNQDKFKTEPRSKIQPNLQPFSKQTTREKIQKQRIDRNQPPPCGYYHPKYSEIDSHNHQVFDYQISSKQTIPKKTQSLSTQQNDELLKPIPEKIQKKKTVLYEMDRQISRPNDIFQGSPGVHEGRFLSFAITDSWSKVPRTPSVPIGSILARDQLIMYKRKLNAPDYEPKFEFGRKGLGSCGAQFQKQKNRGELFPVKFNYTNEHYFEYDHYVNQPQSKIFRTTISPKFDIMLDREQNSNSPIPSYMQKFVNNRTSIGHLNQKMLENNNFSTGRFQSTYSSFDNNKKTVKKRQQTFNQEDLMDIVIDEEFEK